MRVGILGVGGFDAPVLFSVAERLGRTYPDTVCSVIGEVLPINQNTFDRKRSQYSSTLILNAVSSYAATNHHFDRVIGVVDVDLYVAGLSFVFGEAYTPGRAGLISLWRLRPEFYGESESNLIFLERALKEVMHELGHTLGLQHCPRSYCIMHFSNSIFDTDKKQNLLCDQCYIEAALAITNVG